MNQLANVKTALEKQIDSEAACRHVRKLLAQRGWTDALQAEAWGVFSAALHRMGVSLDDTWDARWARAYSYGHNVAGLRNGRLAHFANAYADICEEVDALTPDLEMTLEGFWLQWDRGDTYEGTAGEHWHVAER